MTADETNGLADCQIKNNTIADFIGHHNTEDQ